jgi:dTMP kinase
MSAQRGILVAFEGIDGAGKTTQLGRLAARLEAAGREVVRSREPTDGPWGRKIRSAGGRLPLAEELEAFTEDRRAHIASLIAPALARGAVVLLDRYYPSSAAYQGTRGDPALSVAAVLAHNEAFAPRPDLTLRIDVPVELGLARVGQRGAATPFETRATLEAVKAAFDTMALPGLVHVDGCPGADAVEAAVWAAVAPLLGGAPA